MNVNLTNKKIVCDACQKETDLAIDAPASGRWGYFCLECAGIYSINLRIGSVVRTIEGEWWEEKYPQLVKALKKAKESADEYGLSYIQSMHDAWILYGEEGIRAQIGYVITNIQDEEVKCLLGLLQRQLE